MSRVGEQPIVIPKGVEITVKDDVVTVKGKKATLEQKLMPCIVVTIEENVALVTLAKGCEEMNNFQGLFRSLINNMVIGVTEGFNKILEMTGVGFRATVQGNMLDLQLGFSHPTKVNIPEGIEVKVEKNTVMHISGSDKQVVGQFAAQVRAMKKPEPYKGKGIAYRDEYIRRKAGKTASS